MNCIKILLITVLSGIILIKREGKKCFPGVLSEFPSPNVDTFETDPCGFMDWLRTCAVGTVERRFPVATTLQLPPMVPSLKPHFPSVRLTSVKSYPVVHVEVS